MLSLGLVGKAYGVTLGLLLVIVSACSEVWWTKLHTYIASLLSFTQQMKHYCAKPSVHLRVYTYTH